MAKKRELTDEDRAFLPIMLRSYEIAAEISNGSVTLSADDLLRLFIEMSEQHGMVHQIQEGLKHLFPVINISNHIDEQETAYCERWPISQELYDATVAKHKKESAAAQQSALAELFAHIKPLAVIPLGKKGGGDDPSKTN